MKKIIFLLIAFGIYAGTLNAQNSDVDGIWKLTESYEYEGKTQTYSSNITFKDSGVIEFAGREMGTWVKNESENTLIIKCDQFQGIDGINKIETLGEMELNLINSKGESTILKRMSLPKGKELNNKFTGEWLMEKVEVDGKIEFVGQIMDFNSNGILYAQGMMFGKWDYNKEAKKIVFDITEEKDKMSGEHSIIKSNSSMFSIDVNGSILYFLKIDKEKIAKENSASGLIGTWRLSDEENPDALHILKFNAPDKFISVEKSQYSGSRSTSNGMWIVNKSEKTVIFIGRLEKLRGLNKVIAITNNEISLENNGTIYSFKKEAKQVGEIEHLTYTQNDFFTEDGEGEFKYYDDEQKLPWKDYMEMMMTLVNVKQLVYKHSTLIEGVDVFESETLTADVNSNPQEQELSIDFIFNGYDRYNLPEDTALPPNEFDAYNKLYPTEDNSNFRVVGPEQITTLAGTYDCTVIEVVDGFDRSKKLWMINDKPGIYAKIIDEKRDENFGFYHIYELQEINNKL